MVSNLDNTDPPNAPTAKKQHDPIREARSRGVFDLLMNAQNREEPRLGPSYSAEAARHRPVPLYRPHQPTPRRNVTPPSDKDMTLGALTRRALPYVQPWYPVPGPNASSEQPPDFTWLTESCGGKAAIGVFGGYFCGLLMGVFLGAMSDMTPPVTVINGKEVPQAPMGEQMRTTLRATVDKSLYWGRNFAFITGVFGGTECLVEKYRGTHDVWNSAISGCVTGAALQAKSGPQSAAIGCGGFAVFSLAIDSVFPH